MIEGNKPRPTLVPVLRISRNGTSADLSGSHAGMLSAANLTPGYAGFPSGDPGSAGAYDLAAHSAHGQHLPTARPSIDQTMARLQARDRGWSNLLGSGRAGQLHAEQQIEKARRSPTALAAQGDRLEAAGKKHGGTGTCRPRPPNSWAGKVVSNIAPRSGWPRVCPYHSLWQWRSPSDGRGDPGEAMFHHQRDSSRDT